MICNCSRRLDVGIRCRHVTKNGVEQRNHVFARLIKSIADQPLRPEGVKRSEVELFVGCPSLSNRSKVRLTALSGSAPSRSTFVDQHDRTQAQASAFLVTKRVLRHRAFGGVDQQHDAIDHAQHVRLHRRSRRGPGCRRC